MTIDRDNYFYFIIIRECEGLSTELVCLEMREG